MYSCVYSFNEKSKLALPMIDPQQLAYVFRRQLHLLGQKKLRQRLK
ncbi:hypothetical protein Golax_001756, partial [Gossypium laxum]|nr:hypothetical protein [Gossypium laxum]